MPRPTLAYAAARTLLLTGALILLGSACADEDPPSEDERNNPALNNNPSNNTNNNPDNNANNPDQNNNNPNNTPDDAGNNAPDDADNNTPDDGGLPPADSGDDAASGDEVGADVESPQDVSPDAPEMTADSVIYRPQGETVTASFTETPAGLRTWTMETTQALRDNDPADRRVRFTEVAGEPQLRSGSVLLDALFAMALEEARQNSVTSISDYAFNSGNGVPCDCFETGKNWKYVWTRDTAYAVDLGLGFLDPARSRNSLDFKLSERKAGGGLEIVQDTGSGGSWPVSTDRVIWALGAREALRHLPAAQRAAFAERAWTAIANTIDRDRSAVFDPRDGLYRGEQSFLDWREQTYPSWTREDTVHIATAKALSTNVAHLILLRTAAELAQERRDTAAAARYTGMADDLRAAIRARFWLEDAGLLSAMTGPELDPSVLHKFDLLGVSLAVLHGVATPEEGALMLSRYPHGPQGAPVIWPQQPLTPIYHNRGIWPFVTAYAVLAAREADHSGAFDQGVETLIRGAALNLSHMENFEFWTQRPWVDDGAASGPVVNSRRQLWSVAGYLGAMVKGLLGMEHDGGRVRFRPYLTANLRYGHLAESQEVVLKELQLGGHPVTVTLELPPREANPSGGAYAVSGVTLDGQEIGEGWIDLADLRDGSAIEVRFGATRPARAVTQLTDSSDFRRIWAPREPNLTRLAPDGGGLRLGFDANGEEGVVFHVFRDGVQVASDLTEGTWLDATVDADATSPCYAVEAEFPTSGHRSHHSRPMCWWGEGERIQDVPAWRLRQRSGGGAWATTAGRVHYAGWGDPGDALEIASLRANATGEHLLQLLYGNGAGGLDTGITAGVKEVEVQDYATGQTVAEGTLVLPQLGRDSWQRWGESSFMTVTLEAGHLYRVILRDSPNMSYLSHFRPYTAGNGGGDAPFNRVNISHVRLLPRRFSAVDRPADPRAFNGQDDLAKLDAASLLTPGAQLDDWTRVGVEVQGDFLYIALASPAFTDPYKPLQVYIEAASGALPSPQPSSAGLEYSNLTAQLPFTPTFALSARRLSDDGSPGGPWNGLWRREGDAWTRQLRLEPAIDAWYDAGRSILSIRLPLADLGQPARLRVAAHVVNAAPANEWKELLPPSHTPWMSQSETGYLEIDATTGAVTTH